MTETTDPRRSRRGTAVIVVVLVFVIAVVTVIGLVTAGSAKPGSTAQPTAGAASTTSNPVTATTTPSPTPTVKFTPTPAATATTPQPVKTAALSSPAPIVKKLVAKVSKSEAVQGKANGPGEVAGPAVRFTITITNSTAKRVDLSNTVVNAYYGSQATPATQLDEPGGKPFPASVAAGKSVSGVYLFTVPTAQRKLVKVTVDTSVLNPVVAFVGAAPK